MARIKIISFVNMKGGVAKTTLTANIGYALAVLNKKKVLMVDVDMQANLSQYFMKPKEYVDWITRSGNFKNKLTIMDIYKKRQASIPSTLKKTSKKIEQPSVSINNLTFSIIDDNESVLDLIPSTLELVDLDSTNAENRLKIFLNTSTSKYDFVLIDCPPTMYFSTKSALIASDAYLIPVKPDHLSSFGFLLLEKAISQFEYDYEKKLIQLGTVFTLVKGRATTLMEETEAAMRSLTDRYFFTEKFTDSTYVGEASKYNKTVFQYNQASKQARQIENITNELLVRIKKETKQ